MKLKFKEQQYQIDATESLVRCFAGQTKGHRKETVGRTTIDMWLLGSETIINEIFSNKKIEVTESEILKNVQELQKEQGIPMVKKLEWGLNFTVEMETGTGKTYVYTRSMFELNRQYGWSKFIIMVPSIAIREWVNKSLEITAEHFQEIYGKKIRFSIYNTKNKSNLSNIKNFANTANIEVIIMNYQAFATNSEDARKIYQEMDSTNSEKPIDIIKRARPILIIDEPQKFWPKAEEMLDKFDPLFIVRYSATHKKDYNKIYRLDAIDAYNHKLVKKINVKGVEVVGNTWTSSYLFLDRINVSNNAYPTAHIKMEIEMRWASGIKKILKELKEWDNLYDISNKLQQYHWYVINRIDALQNLVTFTNGVEIRTGQVMWDIDEDHVRRIQIRETINSHLQKERLMYKKWIKVLSLFFIDEVVKYRDYDQSDEKGEYAKIFEEEYLHAISERDLFDTEYNTYLDKHKVDDIHKWYFSIDKKWKFVDSKESKGEGGSDDVSAYDLIMKNKERLLDLNEPTRFIFSHSALREWRDNPNVFQICTLKQSQSIISKRQEIGRWLRICVNSNGDRMDYSTLEGDFFEVNTLTVIASESYDSFAKDLQKEVLESLSDRPVAVTVSVFKDRVLKNKAWDKLIIDEIMAENLIFDFKTKWYLDDQRKITDKMITDIETNVFEVPAILKDYRDEVVDIMIKIHSTNIFRVAADERADNVHEAILTPNENFAKKEFQDLWNKIKIKTVYEVDFDSKELVEKSIEIINKHLEVKKVVIRVTTWWQDNEITKDTLASGEAMKKDKVQIEKTENMLGNITYDLIGEITKWANVTRQTAVDILKGLREDKFRQFQSNPEDFIRQVVDLINQEKAATLINNITYSKTKQEYTDDIFTINNFAGSLKDNILEVKKHIYKYVKTDSKIERAFAQDLENGEISVYAKLPSGFKIPTPVGNYNPDWAIVFDKKNIKYIYFIAETKGSMNSMQLKESEMLKIEYARKHFASLGHADIKYDVISTYEDLRNKVF